MEEFNFYDEIRCGFYVPGLIKRSWYAQMTILRIFDEICRKHDAHWFGMYGTLIGAIRHQGVIPWDDDIDIAMLRSEYNKILPFIQQELPEELELYTYRYNAQHDYQFIASVSLKGHPVEIGCMEKYGGFPFRTGVDIFLFDEVSEKAALEDQRKELMLKSQALYYSLEELQLKTDSENVCQAIENKLGEHLNRRKSIKEQLVDNVLNQFDRFEGEGGSEYSDVRFYLRGWIPLRFSKAWLTDLIEVPFEDRMIPVPREYDRILTSVFGDYHRMLKGTAEHHYPVFHKNGEPATEFFQGSWDFLYKFSADDLVHERQDSLGSIGKNVLAYLQDLLRMCQESLVNGRYEDVLGILAEGQNRALQLGELIEKQRPWAVESVHCLEQYCESVFALYCDIENQLDEQRLVLLDQISERLQKFGETFASEVKTLIVFIPSRFAYWENMRRIYQHACADASCDVMVMPVPYGIRDWDGELRHMEYDGERYDVPIMDYKTCDLQILRPDCIVIDTPYDDCSYTFSVDPQYYSKELKKYTNCLVYVPWFVTGDVSFSNPQDNSDIINMEYYVTVPTLAHADYCMLQSETVKETYIRVLEAFVQGKVDRAVWEQKLIAAGSGVYDNTDKEAESGGSFSVWEKIRQCCK